VPGSGPQLVVAHGGERITPVGGAANSAPISHTTHVVLQLDGTTIAEHVERRIFNNAEGATSGFAEARRRRDGQHHDPGPLELD
jgi:hypothetical protein